MDSRKPADQRPRSNYLLAVIIGLTLCLVMVIGGIPVMFALLDPPAECHYHIQVIVFADNNGNGAQDSGESGIANVNVALETNQTFPGSTPTLRNTDANGSVVFVNNGICTGHDLVFVNVKATPPAGYTATTPLSFWRTLSGDPLDAISVGFRRN